MRALRDALRTTVPATGSLADPTTHVPLASLATGTSLEGGSAALAGRSVLLATAGQLAAGLALIELDGLARRIVLCPPDLKPEYLGAIAARGEADVVVSDRPPSDFADLRLPHVGCGRPLQAGGAAPEPGTATEWALLTSGTTGVPKIAVHSLAGLTAAIRPAAAGTPPPVWATFYDMRRYGGLQIFLRAVLGGALLVLSSPGEAIADHLRRIADAGATHVTGTPSHWRRVLMSPAAHAIAPGYVRLSGEIADQAVLDSLRQTYPEARIGHAYASTEAGVGFEVTDEREGFPASFVSAADRAVRMEVADGSLLLRSAGTASRYLGDGEPPLLDPEGFVDSGDMVELRGERYYFVGRRGGIINVGGLKVHPEEVEAVINRHRDVKMSLVKARRNPITGAIVTADVVLNDTAGGVEAGSPALKQDILQFCRDSLPVHKVPAAIRFVPSLEMTAAGKLARAYA